jgi:hypothetical protein
VGLSTPNIRLRIRHGICINIYINISGRRRNTYRNVRWRCLLATSSVVVGRGSSRRGFFLAAGISSARGDSDDSGTRCSSSAARSKGWVRFAALRRTATARFVFGPLLVTVVSVGMEAPASAPAAWSVGFCIVICVIQ